MLLFRTLVLCCLMLINLPLAQASEISDAKFSGTEMLIIDPDFKLPDFSYQWQQHLIYLAGINTEVIALEARLKKQNNSLENALVTDHASIKRRLAETAREIRFYRNYKKSLSIWRSYISKHSYGIKAQMLGWGLRQQKLRYASGMGLLFMARAYHGGGDLVSALNLAKLALKRHLPKSDRRMLGRDYDLWLANATLRAGDPVYDLAARPINACIAFAHPLAKRQPLPLEDYVRAENNKKLAVSLKGRSLCISGLNYGDAFSLTIRRGLRAANGAVLGADAKRLIKVDNRPASIRFNSDKWLAPITGNEMIAVYSVNLETADLSLYRIGERGLQQAMKTGLFSNSMRSYQAENLANDLGEAVWQGTIQLEKHRNEEVTTLIPVGEMMNDTKPGLYIIKANWQDGEKRKNNFSRARNHPLQWILFSDTGLTAIRGNDGLTVISRRISTAKTRSGVSLKLVAINNEILGTAVSDRKGISRFPAGLLRGKGGNRPSHVIAEAGKGDFTLLRLNRDSLDLSDFDISGRTVPESGDMYLFTERSIYRAGEKVFLTGFLRDHNARAIAGQSVELKLYRPDGTEDRKVMLKGDALGAYAYDFDLGPSARTGHWIFQLSYAGEKTILARQGFDVQDFVPLRLKAQLTTVEKIAQGAEPLDLLLSVDFLYGAPASGLGSQIRAILRPASQPFPDYKKYHFGLLGDSFSALSLLDEKGKLSPMGKRNLSLVVDGKIHTTKPLEIMATATIFDVGGRPVTTSLAIPYRHEAVSVGLRMGDIVTSGEEGRAEAELVVLRADGTAMADRAVKVRWIKEEYDYQWYQRRGYWRSKTVIYDTVMAETEGQSDKEGLLQVARTLPNGSYRIEVADGVGTSQASLRFHVGWWSQNRRANEPDQLDLKLSTTSLKGGERLRGQIKAPFDGKVTLMVITDRVHHIRHLDMKDGTADFNLKVDKDWGTGAYIMATAFRPTGANRAKDAHLPVRATGFAWFDIGHGARRLDVELLVPDMVLPRKTAVIPLKVSGLEKGAHARVTLLAVDEGILRLMAFKSPSLSGHFMGKRALAVAIHDLYGRLLMGEEGRRGTLSVGGDMMNMAERASRMMGASKRVRDNRAGLTTRTRRAVALVTRDVLVGPDGRAEITLDIPDFVGQLRLMAVAYSTDKMGQAVSPLIVRDAIAADVILPRFMAPGDQANPVVSLQNLSGKTQALTVSLETTGPVDVRLMGAEKITLADNERLEIPLLITATGIGTAGFNLTLTGAKAPIERSWQMAVRSPYGYESRSLGRMLAAGETVTLTPEGSASLQKGLVEGESLMSVLLSNAPDLKVDKMLSDLILYGYMCTEQTVSRAMPMLYADRLVKAGLSDKDRHAYAAEIDQAIERLLMRQNRAGDFGLWRAYDQGNAWASLYAIDFLMQAGKAGYHVPEEAMERAFSWIRAQFSRQTHPSLMSYGLYLRARAGDILRGDVRHYAVTSGKPYNTPMADAYLGAALALVGENDLAETHFRRSLTAEWVYEFHKNFYDYGSPLRDRAAAITLLAESRLAPELLFEAGSELERLTAQQGRFNTQQKAWLVRAASVLSGDQPISLSVNGKDISDLKASWQQDILKDMTVTNSGADGIRFVETLRGLPADAPAPVQNGAMISRRYLDLDGKAVDLANIQQNDRFIVLIAGETRRIGTEASLVLDLLPAGLEIENATVGGDSQLDQYKFLPRLSRARYSAELDDRYFAVLDNRRQGRFAFAYMVRAITPGTYVQPPVMIEDMYQPQYGAVGKAGVVKISGANAGVNAGVNE